MVNDDRNCFYCVNKEMQNFSLAFVPTYNLALMCQPLGKCFVYCTHHWERKLTDIGVTCI